MGLGDDEFYLHKEHSTSAVQSVIGLIVTKNELNIKMIGNWSCYFVNQDSFITCSEEELAMSNIKCKEAANLSKMVSSVSVK